MSNLLHQCSAAVLEPMAVKLLRLVLIIVEEVTDTTKPTYCTHQSQNCRMVSDY